MCVWGSIILWDYNMCIQYVNSLKPNLIDKSEYVHYHENMKNQINITIVKMMDRGMMVIPLKLRNELGLKKGDYITAVIRNDEIVLKPHITQEDTKINRRRALIVRKPLISKEAGLKLLSNKTKKPLWNDEDMRFYQEGRDMIEK